MKTVLVLIDLATIDYLLVPIIRELRREKQIRVVPLVYRHGKSDLLKAEGIPYTTDIEFVNRFPRAPGQKLFLNAADTNNPAHRLGWTIDDFCRKHGIPSLTIEHAAHSFYRIAGNKAAEFNADRIALAGFEEYMGYRSSGVDPEKLVITGCPKYDQYYHLAQRGKTGAKHHFVEFENNAGYILFAGVNNAFVDFPFAPGIPGEKWIGVLRQIYEFLIKNFHLNIIIKPHPAEPELGVDKLYEDAIAPEHRARIKIIDPHAPLQPAVSSSKLVLSFSSTVMLEAILLNKPVIFFGSCGKEGSVHKLCEDAGAVFVRRKWLDIEKTLMEDIPHEYFSDFNQISLSKEFVERILHKWDGRAASRISFLIEKMLNSEPVRLNNGVLVDWNVEASIGTGTLDKLNQIGPWHRPPNVIDSVQSDFKDEKTSIIIVTYNSAEDIGSCIESIRLHTRDPYEIVVVDNCSTDGTRDYLTKQKDLKVILNDTNNGFSRGCNQGIETAEGEYVILLNPDTIVTNDWTQRMIAHFKDDIGAVGPVSNYAAGMQKYEFYSIESVEEDVDIHNVSERLYQWNKGVGADSKLLVGFCVMLKKELIRTVGMLDENLFLGSDDLEYSWRLRNCGYRLIVATDTFVYHKGQVSFRSEPEERVKQLTQESQDALFEKLERHYGEGNVPSSFDLWGMNWFKPTRIRDKHSKKTSIIILTHNQLYYTKKCIQSIFDHTKPPFELIVVDNGSTDGTVAYLESLRDRGLGSDVGSRDGERTDRVRVQIIKNRVNLGFAAGNNQGMAVAEGDYLLLMNNDIVVTPGWLEGMKACAERSPNIGIVGPMSNYVSGPQLVEKLAYDLETLEGLDKFASVFSYQNENRIQRFFRVVGFCMLIKKEVIERIGGMDERYGLGNFEDDDFSLRAALAGFESWIAQDSYVHHFGSQTFIGTNIDYNESLCKNWEIFKKKWGLPDDSSHGSYNVSEILKRGFNPKKHIVPLTGDDAQTLEGKGGATGLTQDRIGILDDKRVDDLRFSILIPISDHSKNIERCLERIRSYTPESHEIVLIDIINSEDLSEWAGEKMMQNSKFHLFKKESTATLGKALNHAIEKTSGKYLVLLSEDIIVTKGWLANLVDCHEREPDSGVTVPLSNFAAGRQKAMSAEFVSIDRVDAFSESVRIRNRDLRIPCNLINGPCMLFSRQLYREIGGFDENECQYEDVESDFCFRAALEGRTNLIAGGVYVHCQRARKVQTDRQHIEQVLRNADPQTQQGKKLLTVNALEKGFEAYQREELDEAFQYLLDAIRNSPENPRGYFELVEVLLKTRNYKDALDTLTQMPPLQDGQWHRKMALMGQCCLGMGMHEEAFEHAMNALSLNSSSVIALNLKGELAEELGKAEEAAEYFKRSIKADPGYGLAYTNLGKLLLDSEPEKAIDLMEKGFILSSNQPKSLSNYHHAVSMLGQFGRAIPAFENAVSFYPSNKILRYRFIDLLVKAGKNAAALTQVGEAMVSFGMEEGLLDAALRIRERIGPKVITKESRQTTVSLCMIVKNEESSLANCLLSVSPTVDELIVVDTGSIDRTKDIAKVFGAKIYDFAWSDDFSAARNFAMSKASGDWILALDADETISALDHARFIGLAQNVSLSSPVAFSFETRNYTMLANKVGYVPNDGSYPEEAGIGWMPSVKVRLFPNKPGIGFAYPVHELVEPSLAKYDIPVKESGVPVHHYGKLNGEKSGEKGDRYYHIGLKKLDELRDNIFALRELAVQAGELERHEEAVQIWQKVLAIEPSMSEAFVNMGSAYWQTGQYGQALSCAEKAVSLSPHLKEAHFNRAISLLLLERANDAIPILEKLTESEPGYLSAHFMLGSALACVGKDEESFLCFNNLIKTKLGPGLGGAFEDLASRFLSAGSIPYAQRLVRNASKAGFKNASFPKFFGSRFSCGIYDGNNGTALDRNLAQSWLKEGHVMKSRGQLEDAVACYQKALELSPESPDILNHLGVALFENRQTEDAIVHYRKALHFAPNQGGIMMNLGMAHYRIGEYEDAVSCFQQAVDLQPGFFEAHNGLAVSLKALGRTEEAISSCEKAIDLKPDYAKAYSNLGGMMKDLDRLDKALSAYEQAIAIEPNNAELCHNIAIVLRKQRREEEAIRYLKKAITINPKLSNPHFLMADILNDDEKWAEAIAFYEEGLSLDPDSADALFMLGTCYAKQGIMHEAIKYYEKAIQIQPDNANFYNNCGLAYMNIADFQKSLLLFKRALESDPLDSKTYSNLLLNCHYDPKMDGEMLLQKAKGWETQYQVRQSDMFIHERVKKMSDRIRIGYVSPDFRRHSVSWFFSPLILNHDHRNFEIFCYSDVKKPDDITHRIEELCDHWLPINDFGDYELAQKINGDGIDILVDLAGHTSNNRLRAFLYRPAPVQVTWLGFPGTTGISSMDYRITDWIADPAGPADDCHSEKLERLDRGFLCYLPPDNAPEISEPPVLRKGYVAFGCFNNLSKVNGVVIRVWSKILEQVPDAYLFLKTQQLADKSTRSHFLELFRNNGISSDRIRMLSYVPSLEKHLALYNEIDIALDTFPYNGTTMTCETLWMGVPVVCLRGDRHAARVGASLLTQLGLPELIAETDEEYISKAVALAGNYGLLTEMRKKMRKKMQQSSLCDTVGFARRMEAAYIKMVEAWHK